MAGTGWLPPDPASGAASADNVLNNPANLSLRISESRYRRLFETAQDGILLLNADTAQIEDVNPYLIHMLGYSHLEFLGKKLWEVGSFADISQSKEIFAALQLSGYVRYENLPLTTKTGLRIQVEFVSNSYDCEGIKVIQCNIRDITERKALDSQILRHIQLYAALSQCNKAIVHCVDQQQLFLQICRAAVEYGGMKTAFIGLIEADTEVLGIAASFGESAAELSDIEISACPNSPFGQGPIGVAIRTRTPFWCQDFSHDPLNIPWLERGKKAGWAASACLPLYHNQQVIGAFVLYSSAKNSFDAAACDLLVEMATDISFALDNLAREVLRKQAEADIAQLAFYDPLTALPNRRLLHNRLQQTLNTEFEPGRHSAMFMIDLDNFKNLNDSLGHNIGDLLLIEVAKRLQACVSATATVARLGGDEFIVLVSDLDTQLATATSQAAAIGHKILAAISQVYSLKGNEYHGSTSIGISLFTSGNTTETELLKHTDTAMYQAKSVGGNNLYFYNPALQAALEIRTELGRDLHSAISGHQLSLYYQAQVDNKRQVLGAEALLRWQHPQRGLISPLLFIPLAEEKGVIIDIGHWVLESACVQLKAWEADPRFSALKIAVNVSARQFYQVDFVEQVICILRKTAVDPHKLRLELTESVVMDDIDDTIVKMHALRRYGVSFSLDDFGTGYSSLSYLTQLPVDQLKIDQSFVHNIGVKHSDAIIVQTIIGMADNLGMEVLAEGVETEAQRLFLAQHGCRHYQGFLFCRPAPIAELETLVIPAPAAHIII